MKEHLAELNTTLNCPVNCPYLNIYLDTGNCSCSLGLRVSSPTNLYNYLEEKNEE